MPALPRQIPPRSARRYIDVGLGYLCIKNRKWSEYYLHVDVRKLTTA